MERLFHFNHLRLCFATGRAQLAPKGRTSQIGPANFSERNLIGVRIGLFAAFACPLIALIMSGHRVADSRAFACSR